MSPYVLPSELSPVYEDLVRDINVIVSIRERRPYSSDTVCGGWLFIDWLTRY